MKIDGSDRTDKGKSLERSPVQSLKDLLNSDYVKNRFIEVMGEKAPAFLVSVLNAVQRNPDLARCDQNSILSSAMAAAILDLPIDANLGFSAIVPYKTKMIDKKTKKEYWIDKAQFQIMYKGFIQLALRSGQYKTINVSPIYEDEFESYDIVTGDIMIHPVAGGHREKEKLDKIIGYVAFFRLINGFERIEYWSLSKIKAHGERYSKSFKNANGLWKKDPHAMYAKTVLKNTISKWGILSVTMQTAVVADQAVIKDFSKPIDEGNVSYVDNFTEETTEAESAGAESQNDDTPPAEETGENTTEQTQAPTAEKQAGKKTSNAETATPAAAATGGNTQNGLFPKDEADALEEQYQRHKAGTYPDFQD
jgi:recombination protein RecT